MVLSWGSPASPSHLDPVRKRYFSFYAKNVLMRVACVQALVDISSDAGWLDTALSAMVLVQSFMQVRYKAGRGAPACLPAGLPACLLPATPAAIAVAAAAAAQVMGPLRGFFCCSQVLSALLDRLSFSI